MRRFRIAYIISASLLALAVSACGGGGSGAGGGTTTAVTGNQNAQFDCVVTNYNPLTEEALSGEPGAWADECNLTGSASLTEGSTYTITIDGWLNGAAIPGDTVTVTSVSNAGYFNSVTSEHSTTVTLDSSGSGRVAYVQNTTGTGEVTLTSSTLAAGSGEREYGSATTTLTFSVP